MDNQNQQNGQYQMPPNGQYQMPPNGQYQMPPNGQYQMPPNGQYQMPPNGQYQMPPNGQYQMPPNGQYQMPPNGQYQMPPNGQYQMPPQNMAEDQLGAGGIALAYVLVLFFGIIGIIVTSVLYYSWKKDFPNKASQMNMHSWIAFLIAVITFIIGIHPLSFFVS